MIESDRDDLTSPFMEDEVKKAKWNITRHQASMALPSLPSVSTVKNPLDLVIFFFFGPKYSPPPCSC